MAIHQTAVKEKFLSFFSVLLLWMAATLVPGIQSAQAQSAAAPGPEICVGCHETQVHTFSISKHGVKGDSRTPAAGGGCVTCHGDGTEHVKAGGGRGVGGIRNPGGKTMAADDKNGLCMTCHKGKARTNWDGSLHKSNDVACTDCHKMHEPADKVLSKKTQTDVCFTCHREQRADSLKISTHPIKEGKVVCSDCHNPHGSPGPSLVKKNTINETCYTCHAERRGPFLFEHQPVVENCANCHLPHGSNLSPMLVSRAPFLCQSCHDGQHSSESPIGRNAASNQAGFTGTAAGFFAPSNQAAGRACLNCHSVIHGSNSPNGGYLQR
jgi:DmsE family decaheme c-type cytochrome